MSTFHLIDAPVWIFRAYYSLPSMRAPDGTPTNAAYGFANTLIKYLTDREPTHLSAVFDFSMESFRNDVFPDYKAQRGDPPDDLEPQFEICADVARALGVAVHEREGFEADDVIATLATRLADRGDRVVVISTDKDLAQLVREDASVVLWDTAKERSVDADGVRERFGVDPQRIPDYLGLVGDAVDNLPGVPGVGPKSASALLRAFARIEDVPADPEKWRGVELRGAKRLAGLVALHRAQALACRELATLVRDVPGVRADPRTLAWRGADRGAVETLFARLGWDRIATRIPRWR